MAQKYIIFAIAVVALAILAAVIYTTSSWRSGV